MRGHSLGKQTRAQERRRELIQLKLSPRLPPGRAACRGLQIDRHWCWTPPLLCCLFLSVLCYVGSCFEWSRSLDRVVEGTVRCIGYAVYNNLSLFSLEGTLDWKELRVHRYLLGGANQLRLSEIGMARGLSHRSRMQRRAFI